MIASFAVTNRLDFSLTVSKQKCRLRIPYRTEYLRASLGSCLALSRSGAADIHASSLPSWDDVTRLSVSPLRHIFGFASRTPILSVPLPA